MPDTPRPRLRPRRRIVRNTDDPGTTSSDAATTMSNFTPELPEEITFEHLPVTTPSESHTTEESTGGTAAAEEASESNDSAYGESEPESLIKESNTRLEKNYNFRKTEIIEGEYKTSSHGEKTYKIVTAKLITRIGVFGSDCGEFNSPKGVFLDKRGGRFYVADTSNSRIQIFDETGAFVDQFSDITDVNDVVVTSTVNGTTIIYALTPTKLYKIYTDGSKYQIHMKKKLLNAVQLGLLGKYNNTFLIIDSERRCGVSVSESGGEMGNIWIEPTRTMPWAYRKRKNEWRDPKRNPFIQTPLALAAPNTKHGEEISPDDSITILSKMLGVTNPRSFFYKVFYSETVCRRENLILLKRKTHIDSKISRRRRLGKYFPLTDLGNPSAITMDEEGNLFIAGSKTSAMGSSYTTISVFNEVYLGVVASCLGEVGGMSASMNTLVVTDTEFNRVFIYQYSFSERQLISDEKYRSNEEDSWCSEGDDDTERDNRVEIIENVDTNDRDVDIDVERTEELELTNINGLVSLRSMEMADDDSMEDVESGDSDLSEELYIFKLFEDDDNTVT